MPHRFQTATEQGREQTPAAFAFCGVQRVSYLKPQCDCLFCFSFYTTNFQEELLQLCSLLLKAQLAFLFTVDCLPFP